MQRVFVLRGPIQAKMLWGFLKTNWVEMAQVGKPLQVTISEYKSKRSVEQNKRYWAILNEIAEQAFVGGKQFSAEAWHELFKRQFIGCEELPNGQMNGISTTILSVSEFGDYMTKIERYAAEELGCEISQ
jgi:hypothetical protein